MRFAATDVGAVKPHAHFRLRNSGEIGWCGEFEVPIGAAASWS
jgi:hypothetical protein